MDVYYHSTRKDGELIFSDFPTELLYLVENRDCKSGLLDLEIEEVKTKARLGFAENIYGKIYVLSTNDKHIRNQKIFKEVTKISLVALKSLVDFKESITKNQNDQTQELIHNLTSLNSYCIQDLYSLIPQDLLSENINHQKETVKKLIAEKPYVTSETLLQILKYNLASKVEFSVFEKTLRQYPSTQKMEDSIRSVILSILQIFISDFDQKKIGVSMSSSDKRLMIDYDSLSVSLYYILENAVKYCCKKSQLKIFFVEEENCFSVVFDMISLEIKPNELHRLTEKNYRSKAASQINEDGAGIGMYRIKKTLKLNDAELEITPRISSHFKEINNIKYEHNQFKVKFMGQQDWFKVNMA